MDIKITEIAKQPMETYKASWLKLMFEGADVNIKIMNALRRVSMVNIPTYAIPAELIDITTNTAVAFDSSYMRLRLGFLPVLGIDCGLHYLNETLWKGINFSDKKRLKHDNEKKVDFYINTTNTSSDISNVTTNDVEMYINDEKIKNPYNKEYPILLIKLRPFDIFKCHMRAVLCVGEVDARWRMARNAFYKQHTQGNRYELQIEGCGQTDEYEILIRACKYIMHKMHIIKERIIDIPIEEGEIVKLKLDNEDHTVGELLNYFIQDHPGVKSSGVAKPNGLFKSMTLTIRCEDVGDVKDIIAECADIIYDRFEYILKQLESVHNTKKK